MPYIKIQSMLAPAGDAAATLALRASQVAAEAIGKEEKWVLVSVERPLAMTFGGETAPCAFIEAKTIGLPAPDAARVIEALTKFVAAELGLPFDRIFVECADLDGRYWGWDGGPC